MNVHKLWKNNRFFIIFIFLMVIFRTSIADWNTVPTGSMKPTILEGDRIWVNKLAYDFKLPFTNISLAQFDEPKRGEIIIFESETADLRLIKRVIAVPGDTVRMKNNMLFLNGNALNYHLISKNNDKLIFKEKSQYSNHNIQINQAVNPPMRANPRSATAALRPITAKLPLSL